MQHNLKFREEISFYEDELDTALTLTVAEKLEASNPSSGSFWFKLLCLLLVLDGMLTYIGISHSSTEFEANLLVKGVMDSLGIGGGILLTKFFAFLSLYILWRCRKEILWIFTAIKGLVFVYISLALLPWLYVFAFYLFPIV